MGRINPPFVRGSVSTGATHPQSAPSGAKPTGGVLLAEARARAWNSSPQMLQLKAALSEAGKTVGSEKQWPQLQAQLSACLPTNDRVKTLGLAIDAALKLAVDAAATGNGDAYRLAMRRLWTATNFVDF